MTTRWLAAAALLVLGGCAAPVESSTPVRPSTPQVPKASKPAAGKPSKPAPVPAGVRVLVYVDGDTLKVPGATVRLIGLDTPERGQCGYRPARDHLRALVAGRPVVLSKVAGRDDRDRYGRLLRYVATGGRDLGLAQIQGGYGTARYDGRDGYGSHPKQAAYIAADAAAPARGCPAKASGTAPFRSCAEARAAGVSLPLTPGSPRWSPRLDRDRDGKACEGSGS
jgi:endonuclease YncB( thermonuclease family)